MSLLAAQVAQGQGVYYHAGKQQEIEAVTNAVQTKEERARVMQRRFAFAKASLAIEGLTLTKREEEVFMACVSEGCTLDQMESLLKKEFPDTYAKQIR